MHIGKAYNEHAIQAASPSQSIATRAEIKL